MHQYTEIRSGSAEARVRKVHTRNGARLEVHTPGTDRRVLLDALLLESISWQTPETFAASLDPPPGEFALTEDAEVEAQGDYTEVGNEFATALVREVRAGDESRLEVFSPKLDYRVYLDAALLESLTRQTPETLSRFLEEPYGPRGTHEPDGLVNLG